MQVVRGQNTGRQRWPGVAKFGIALEWGSRGLEFESQHSDQENSPNQKIWAVFCFLERNAVVSKVNDNKSANKGVLWPLFAQQLFDAFARCDFRFCGQVSVDIKCRRGLFSHQCLDTHHPKSVSSFPGVASNRSGLDYSQVSGHAFRKNLSRSSCLGLLPV